MGDANVRLVELEKEVSKYPIIAGSLESILRIGKTPEEKADLLETAIKQVERPRSDDF